MSILGAGWSRSLRARLTTFKLRKRASYSKPMQLVGKGPDSVTEPYIRTFSYRLVVTEDPLSQSHPISVARRTSLTTPQTVESTLQRSEDREMNVLALLQSA